MSNTYEFPEGVDPCSMMSMGDSEKTRKAIIEAAKWMDCNPDIQPSFTSMAGTVVNTNDKTVAMTTAVLDAADARETQQKMGLCFSTYAVAVLNIKEHGWSWYIERLGQSKGAEG